jgi:hypothetical protein
MKEIEVFEITDSTALPADIEQCANGRLFEADLRFRGRITLGSSQRISGEILPQLLLLAITEISSDIAASIQALSPQRQKGTKTSGITRNNINHYGPGNDAFCIASKSETEPGVQRPEPALELWDLLLLTEKRPYFSGSSRSATAYCPRVPS